MEVEIARQKFVLDCRKAMFQVDKKRLILADLHVGKSAHFRRSGFSMPDYGFQNDVLRLVKLMEEYQPKELLILGDLYHSQINDEFDKWHGIMDRFRDCEFHLVIGNHDRSSMTNNPFLSDFTLHETLNENGILFSHEPVETKTEVNFCGHIHPGIRLTGQGRQSLNLPCFYLSKNQMILPAFSELTGLARLKPTVGDKLYVCSDTKITEFSED